MGTGPGIWLIVVFPKHEEVRAGVALSKHPPPVRTSATTMGNVLLGLLGESLQKVQTQNHTWDANP